MTITLWILLGQGPHIIRHGGPIPSCGGGGGGDDVVTTHRIRMILILMRRTITTTDSIVVAHDMNGCLLNEKCR